MNNLKLVALTALGVVVTPIPSVAQRATPSPPKVELLLQDPLQFATPGDRCEAQICLRLLALIGGAEQTIDFAIYGARNQTAILEALVAAQARGVTVRGIVDRDITGSNYYTSTDEWVSRLGTVGSDRAREAEPESEGDFEPKCTRPNDFTGPLQCLAFDLGRGWLLAEHASRDDFTDPESGGVNHIMHDKFFVVDGRYVWTGSANISDSGTGGYNANAVIVMDSREVAAIYARELDQLLARSSPDARKARDGIEVLRLGDAEITTWFSPQDDAMRFGVEGLIAKARHRVDVAVFYLTNKYVTAELIGAHNRGVDIRVIVDATSAKNGYTKHELLRVAGLPVKVENWGGKMHMKAAAIDGEYLIVGSMNWTRAGEDTNDENTLLIRSPEMSEQFHSFFDALWASIPTEFALSGARPDPESRLSGTACSDGVDNDFDDLADDDDPGCGENPRPLELLPPHQVVRKTSTRPPSTHRLYSSVACDPSYPDWFVCIPLSPPARDLDCGQIPYRRLAVRSPDGHRFDVDRNGIGCEGAR